MQASVKITAQEFGSKFQTKSQIHSFLTVEVGAYLPAADCLTIYFMRDLAMGRKKYLKASHVKYLTVPQYEGLSVESLLDQCAQSQEVMKHLPCERDIHRCPRQFIANILYSIEGEQVAQFVRDTVNQRNEKMAERRNMNLCLDPVIADCWQKSSALALTRGSGFHMLKPTAKRRRTQKELQNAKLSTHIGPQAYDSQVDRIKQLQDELAQYKNQATSNQNAAEILTGFIKQGDCLLQEDGTVILASKSEQSSAHVPNEIRNHFMDI